MKALKKDVKATAYCGPTIVGAITGKSLSVVHEAIRQDALRERYDRAGRNRPVRGTSTGELMRAFKKFGWEMSRYRVYTRESRPTLAAFLRQRTPEERKMTMVLVIGTRKPHGWFGGAWAGGHWIAVTGKKFVDSYTGGEPVWLSKAPHRRKRVDRVFVVEKT